MVFLSMTMVEFWMGTPSFNRPIRQVQTALLFKLAGAGSACVSFRSPNAIRLQLLNRQNPVQFESRRLMAKREKAGINPAFFEFAVGKGLPTCGVFMKSE